MSLQDYKARRHFKSTPEPAAVAALRQGPLRFVVQKHHATRLHYDLRLELNGALKSWAVPKGPSLDPKEKRLAVLVEDHPLAYRTFEGIIPKGNYGAGTVMVWDEGVYHSRLAMEREASERQLEREFEDGNLKFILYGKKLKGEFALVKLKNAEPDAWLLLKKEDRFASTGDVLQLDRSAITGRDLDQIRDGVPITPLDLSDAPLGKMPHNVEPMLAQAVAKPFDRPGWFFEIKWDGYRAIAEVDGARVHLYSRRQLPYNDRYGPVVESLRGLGCQAVLDGEVVVVDTQGKPSFASLQDYGSHTKGHLVYYVFDILYLNGHDLRKLPLRRRKSILTQTLIDLPNVKISEHVEEQGVAFFEAIKQQGLEGMMAKDAKSAYREGARSDAWLKVKMDQRQEAIITGFSAPKGSRQALGSLVLGVYDEDELRFIGQVGSGFNDQTLQEVRALLEPLRQKECPFATRPKTKGKITWVKPSLLCEVAFQDWSKDGLMRFPVFLGLRSDKPARAVEREKPLPPPVPTTLPAKNGLVNVEGATVPVTNLNKIYWPDEGYTKGDLVRYYQEISWAILPYLVDRPESLNRHPDGIKGKNFFQKNLAGDLPAWIQTIELPTDSKRRSVINYLLCQNAATLVYLANLGCIELNPWSSRRNSLDTPDYLLIDLDPEDVPFATVVRAAQEVRRVLDKAGGACYCKTSGKRGLHVYVPLAAQHEHEVARRFAELVAQLVHSELPDTTSLIRMPAKRQQRVYLDCLQNGRGKTLAAPYSVRPVAGAQVSTPLQWTEVRSNLDPTRFTIKTMPERLNKLGDIWKPVLGEGIALAECVERLSRHFGANARK